jgi:hypothetical protein
MTHIRVRGDVAQEVLSGSKKEPCKGTGLEPKRARTMGPKGPGLRAQKGLPIKEREKKREKEEEKSGVLSHASGPASSGTGADPKEATMVKPVKTVAELMAETGGKKATVQKKGTAKSLEFLWKEIVSETTGNFVPAFTMKQLGQLGQFLKRCPTGTAEDVMSAALKDWPGFAGQVKSDAGLKAVPLDPNLDFLLKYLGPAVDFAKPKYVAPHKVFAFSAPEVQLFAKPVGKPVPEVPAEAKPQTWDDLAAILGTDDPATKGGT